MQIPTLSRRANAACFVLAGSLPALAYGTGAGRAKAIEQGQPWAWPGYVSNVVWSGGKVLVNSDRTLGNFVFFWTDRDSVLVARWDEIAPLELRVQPKATDNIAADSPG